MLKVFLTDLAAYNSGALIGKWIELPLTDLELHTAINEVLTEGEAAVDGENHEEWFITDYEWEAINLCSIDEYENVFKLNSKLELLIEVDEYKLKAIKFILDEQFTADIKDAILKADDVIVHSNQSLEDVAYDLIQECYDVDILPKIISNNIDYKGIAKDLESDGIYFEVDGDIFEYIG